MLLDGSFLGKAAGKFSSRGVCIWKCIFTETKYFTEMLTPVQYFEGK